MYFVPAKHSTIRLLRLVLVTSLSVLIALGFIPIVPHALAQGGALDSTITLLISTNNQPIAVSSNLLNYCGGSDTISYPGINR